MVIKSNVTKSGSAPDAYAASYITFDGFQSRLLFITIEDFAVDIKFSWDGLNYVGDEMKLNVGDYIFELECKGFKIKNNVALNTAAYQVVAFHSAGFTS